MDWFCWIVFFFFFFNGFPLTLQKNQIRWHSPHHDLIGKHIHWERNVNITGEIGCLSTHAAHTPKLSKINTGIWKSDCLHKRWDLAGKPDVGGELISLMKCLNNGVVLPFLCVELAPEIMIIAMNVLSSTRKTCETDTEELKEIQLLDLCL